MSWIRIRVSRFRKPRGALRPVGARGRTGTDVCGRKKRDCETKGVRGGVGRNLINLFIKRFSCLCWGCRVPTGNTRRLNEYRRRRRRRRRLNSAAIHREEVRAGSGTDTLFLMESTWSTGGHQSFRIQRRYARARDSSNFRRRDTFSSTFPRSADPRRAPENPCRCGKGHGEAGKEVRGRFFSLRRRQRFAINAI